MTVQTVSIWFVVWPDGKMFEGTQTSISQSHAIQVAIRSWLPSDFFPDLDMGSLGFGVTGSLWKSMEKAGFKCHEIDTVAVGISK